MTIVVAIKCSDGVVVSSDSMITVNEFAQYTGKKIHLLPGQPEQLFAFAGNLAYAERFRAVATFMANQLTTNEHKLKYATDVGGGLFNNLQLTGLKPLEVELETILAFVKDGVPEVCVFDLGSQPHYLDQDYYYVTLGSGSVAATPFLKFLTDILFFKGRQPTVAEGKLLGTWAVKYAIDTLAQGVGTPIDIATIEKNEDGGWNLSELDRLSVDETLQAIDTASEVLRTWRNGWGACTGSEEIPQLPANVDAKG
jgi:20S proteasome alpha/beta subunit